MALFEIMVTIAESDDAIEVRRIVGQALQDDVKPKALARFARDTERVKDDREAILRIARKVVVIQSPEDLERIEAAGVTEASPTTSPSKGILESPSGQASWIGKHGKKLLDQIELDFAPGESLIAFARGQAPTAKGKDTNGVVALTTKRIYYYGSLLQHRVQVSYPLEKVDSIQHSSALLLSAITITVPGDDLEVKSINKDDAQRFAASARKQLDLFRSPPTDSSPQPAVASPQVTSAADELAKMAALRDSGVLTDAEFEEQKAKLLSR